MSLRAYLQPWSGVALRHIPASSPFEVLDFRFAGQGSDNRWNEQGQPTLYLAGDEGVLVAEWGRHFALSRSPELRRQTVERAVFLLDLSLDRVLDLRAQDVCEALSLEHAPVCFTDLGVARSTANFIRATTDAQGVLTPSMGFLDDLGRWCLVVFLNKMPSDPKSFISNVTRLGPLR